MEPPNRNVSGTNQPAGESNTSNRRGDFSANATPYVPRGRGGGTRLSNDAAPFNPSASANPSSADAPSGGRTNAGRGRQRDGEARGANQEGRGRSGGRAQPHATEGGDTAPSATAAQEQPKRGGGEGRRNGGRRAPQAEAHAGEGENAAGRGEQRRGGRSRGGGDEGRGRGRGRGGAHREADADSRLSSHMSRASFVSTNESSNNDKTPFITSDQAENIVRDVEGTAATKRICTELLTGEYECVLCLVPIRAKVATWSCKGCFHVFHLSCVKHWAKQPESGSGKTFRCPHCQAPNNTATGYYCFCTKQSDPKYDPNIIPHSCGDVCNRKRGYGCTHTCPSLCHPGPCPPCPRFHSTKCPCGASSYEYGCDKPDPKITCNSICGKLLPCGNHSCTKICHNGPCGKCEKTQETPCVCGKDVKALPCGSEPFQCNKPCDKIQRCGKHKCPVTCHSGNCPPCDYDPAAVDTCPCGKCPLTTKRTSCGDEIPTCDNICAKALLCGNHICEEKCHVGPCKQCNIKILSKCRCGQVQAKVLCSERDQFRCEKKCKTPLKCGKHECPELCCAYRGHIHPNNNECPRVCGKQLLCGHVCQERCHPGLCQACPNVITSVLQCRCGNNVLIPPLPCGTQPPRCFLPCTLQRSCGHPQTKHDCHYDECPPCTHLVKRRCDGGHKEVEVFCHSKNVCCGAKCGRILPCGHSCDRLCHSGPCADHDEVCKRPCGKEVAECGHFCQIPCHSNKPSVVCKCTSKVSVPCECGLRSEELTCNKYQKLVTKRIEERLAAASVVAAPSASAASTPSLDGPLTTDCTADCAYQNRLSALAARSAPKIEAQHKSTIYSLRLWEIAGGQLDVVGKIETKMNEFIRDATNVSLMMPPMPKERRMIVHELANFYGLLCESVDVEPNRSCYLTKTMKSKIPDPQLTAARINRSYHSKCDPTAIIPAVLSSNTLAPAQTLVFIGDKHLNEIAIHTYLKEIIGSFVAVNSDAAYGLSPRLYEPLMDLLDEHTYFAVFATKYDTDAGFAILRKNGCPCLYQRIGEAPPPAKHNWEPRRDPNSSSAALESLPEQRPIKSWGEMATKVRMNAKERKEQEANTVEVSGGAFASLARKK